ncbi:hypothetical protein LINGRAHAP2_LOCUS5290 [Linum grandiflorum]
MANLTEQFNASNDGRNRGRRDGQPRKSWGDVPVRANSDSNLEDRNLEADKGGGNQQQHNDYRVKTDIPLFYGTMRVDEFLDWLVDVDRFFDLMGVPENKQVKMVAIRFKSIAALWWDKLVFQRQCQRKAPIRTWRRMKQLMLERFLPNDYEKILYKMYVNCVQGRMSVTEYTAEFLRLTEHNRLGETEGKKVMRYINGLKGSIQEKMRLQTVWTVTEASTLALKVELREKSPKNFSSIKRFPPQEYSDVAIDKDKDVGPNEPNNTESTSGVSISNPNKGMNPKPANPYARPMSDKCLCCGGQGHKSDVCPSRRTIAILNEESGEDGGNEDAGVEFIEEHQEDIVVINDQIDVSQIAIIEQEIGEEIKQVVVPITDKPEEGKFFIQENIPEIAEEIEQVEVPITDKHEDEEICIQEIIPGKDEKLSEIVQIQEHIELVMPYAFQQQPKWLEFEPYLGSPESAKLPRATRYMVFAHHDGNKGETRDVGGILKSSYQIKCSKLIQQIKQPTRKFLKLVFDPGGLSWNSFDSRRIVLKRENKIEIRKEQYSVGTYSKLQSHSRKMSRFILV